MQYFSIMPTPWIMRLSFSFKPCLDTIINQLFRLCTAQLPLDWLSKAPVYFSFFSQLKGRLASAPEYTMNILIKFRIMSCSPGAATHNSELQLASLKQPVRFLYFISIWC